MSTLLLGPPYDEFTADPAADYEQQSRYLDRCRRVRVGPAVALVFENPRTLAFRVRELEHLARLTGPDGVRPALDWYARLLPAPGVLVATLQVRAPGRRPSDRLNALARRVAAGAIEFRVGGETVSGDVRPTAGGDRVLGPAYWVQFAFGPAARAALADPHEPAAVAVAADGYDWASDPLPPPVRRSLRDDLGDA